MSLYEKSRRKGPLSVRRARENLGFVRKELRFKKEREHILKEAVEGYRNFVQGEEGSLARRSYYYQKLLQSFIQMDGISDIESHVERVKRSDIFPVRYDTESDPDIEINPNVGVVRSSGYSVESLNHDNQDAFCIYTTEDGTNYMAVLDGVGGVQSQSAVVAVEILNGLVYDITYDINSKPLNEVVFEIDSRLKKREGLYNQGTTLSLVRIIDNRLEGASVGDSPIMIIDEDKNSKRARIITRGHTLARQIDQKEIGEKKDLTLLNGSQSEIRKVFNGLGRDAPIRNSYERTITSSLNNPSEYLKIDYVEKQLRPGSKVVLFSDGLPKNMSLTEILLALEVGMTPEDIVGFAKAKSKLNDQEGAANHRLGIDDITMVVVEMGTIA